MIKCFIRFNPFPWMWRQLKKSPWLLWYLVIKLWDWVGCLDRIANVLAGERIADTTLQLFHLYETIPRKKKFVTNYERRRQFRADKQWTEETHEKSKLMNFVKAEAIANYRVRPLPWTKYFPPCDGMLVCLSSSGLVEARVCG